jgi:hypothetical protein
MFLPIALINTYSTYKLVKQEAKLLEDTINSNNDFFTAIATMNFAPDEDHAGSLTSIMEVDEVFSIQDIQEIAKETIIKTIMNFVKDEELLGIVVISCNFVDDNSKVKITLSPAHREMFENDKADLYQSIKLTSIYILIAVIAYFIITKVV